MSYHLVQIIQQWGHPRVLVIGDAILDRYVWGDAERISQEAPVILLRADKDEDRLGGAANVANMVRGLEAEVTLATVVGPDADGECVVRALQAAGVDTHIVLTDPSRPTSVKERFIGRAQQRHPHQMLRVDREVRHPLSDDISQQMLDAILPQLDQYAAVLVADYGKGVCTPRILREIYAAAKHRKIPVVVDPRPGTDYSHYRGATAVTPNRLETKLATGREIRTPDDAFAAGRQLCDMLDLDYAFVTLDSDGIALVFADGRAQLLPTRKRHVYDITGAGDMVLATIGVGLAEGLSPEDIARLANVAGGLEVEKVGVVPIHRQEMLADLLNHLRTTPEKVCQLDELLQHIAARRKLGQKIVFTNGCFDLLHMGHVGYLRQAACEGDCLIVAINSDDSVRRLNKAPERPLFPQDQRAGMLAALQAVDYVVIFDEDTPHALLHALQPDLLVKGGTYSHHEIVGWEVVEAYGGEVKPLGITPGISTTRIVECIRQGRSIASANIPANIPANASLDTSHHSLPAPHAAQLRESATPSRPQETHR